jgi:uncharacterized protein (TIGR00730 family)
MRLDLLCLPTSAKGSLTRAAILKAVQWPDLADDTIVTVYCGSRAGADPVYLQEATALGAAIAAEGWHLVYGGGTSGLMGAVAAAVKAGGRRVLAIVPKTFVDGKPGTVANEGLNGDAINVVVPDMYERKTIMDLLASAFFVLPGGFGTIEEFYEAILFAKKHGKRVHFVNTKGFWNNAIAQMDGLTAAGFMDESDTPLFTVSDTAAGAVAEARKISSVPQRKISDTPKPAQCLRDFLAGAPNDLLRPGFLAGRAPVVGMLLSGTLPASTETALAYRATARLLGTELAQKGAVIAICGDRRGLRAELADAALAAGGRLVWIVKTSVATPLETSCGEREITLSVARRFEQVMIMDRLSTSVGFLPGGLGTMDKLFEVVTRGQIKSRPEDPVIGCNLGGILDPILAQIDHATQEGFINPHHRSLLAIDDDEYHMAEELVRLASKDQAFSNSL